MFFDVLILGGGPAGLTAGLYAARAGLQAALFEGEFAGGQAATTDKLENYPGFPGGVGGPELMMAFERQAVEAGLSVFYERVERCELAGDRKKIHTARQTYEAKTVILATGASPRKLGVPGERELIGRGVSYCATCDGALYKDKTVAVVGGGATAVEDALYLSSRSDVVVIHRRDSLRAPAATANRAMEKPRVRFLWDSVVQSIEKTDSGLSLSISNVKNGDRSVLEVAACFVAVGTDPSNNLFKDQVALDEAGYVEAGEDTLTSVRGVFAAGDARKKPLKQVVTAVSDGAVAATAAAHYIQTTMER